jgi:pimeloyl-ACP methyl ester carboxylesterase
LRGEFVEVAGARLYYYAAGSRGKGDPIVFLHGFPASSHLWSDLVPLMPAGHRMVVLDLLGYGRSDRPGAHALSIPAHAERVLALMDTLRITRAAIVGHDLGGGIAQHLAIEHAARVARVALISSVGFDGWPPKELKMARAALPFARRMPAKPLMNALRRALKNAYEDAEHGAHSVEMYLRPFETPGGREALMAHVAALDAEETMALVPRLRAVKVPVAIIWGDADPLINPDVGIRLHEAMPASRLELLPGVKHFPPETAPETVARVLGKWLAE